MADFYGLPYDDYRVMCHALYYNRRGAEGQGGPSGWMKAQSLIVCALWKSRSSADNVEKTAPESMACAMSVAPKRAPEKSHAVRFDSQKHVSQRVASRRSDCFRSASERFAPVRFAPLSCALCITRLSRLAFERLWPDRSAPERSNFSLHNFSKHSIIEGNSPAQIIPCVL